MKKLIIPFLVLVTLVTVVFAGCAAPAEAPPTEPEPAEALTVGDVPELADLVAKGALDPNMLINPYAGLSIKPDGTPFHFTHAPMFLGVDFMVNGEGIIESLIRRSGAEYTSKGAEYNPDIQIAFIEDVIAEGKTDAIDIISVDEFMLVPVLEKAMDAGIPVFSWGVEIRSDDAYVANCLRREEAPGASDVVGQFYVDYVESTGEELTIYEIWGMRSLELCQFRHEGFHAAVDQSPLITVIESPDCEWSDEISANLVQDALVTHPEINAIYHMGGGGTGAIAGLKAMGRLVAPDDPKHILTGFNDTDTITIETMLAGELDACGSHQCWDTADTSVKLMLTSVVCGKEVPHLMNIPYSLITVENLYTTRILGCPVNPLMPTKQWDLWPVLDTFSPNVSPGLFTGSSGGNRIYLETPTKAMRMATMGY